MVNWIKDRIVERTSWDGGVLIAVGVVGQRKDTVCVEVKLVAIALINM